MGAGGAGADVGWGGQWRSYDESFGERRGELRHAAELEDGYILVGIESVFLHEIAQGEIGR